MLSQHMDESDPCQFGVQLNVVNAGGPGRPRYDMSLSSHIVWSSLASSMSV